ncbi:MAG TPA: aldehyde dehydrogenase family protein [Kofleriaceae bacterium]|jgi:aldehyde dehydrogenase (NAD+)
MQTIDHIYLDGAFVRPHGSEVMTLLDPATEEPVSQVVLADEDDARRAIAAAVHAWERYRTSTHDERRTYLERLGRAVGARVEELADVMAREYGAPRAFARASAQRAADAFGAARDAMAELEWTRTIGKARVTLEPLGVVGLITPWNASNGFICSKLAMALAAGSTAVIKPSELSAAQTQLLTECFRAAELPPGLFHIVTGRGEVVGAELVRSPDIAKISFTGSTAVGKSIVRDGAATLKRVTLELGGKSPNVLLDDADFARAIPLALQVAYMNSGQACIAGTRLLVPATRMAEARERLIEAVARVRVPDDVGPMVNAKQYERVQGYIRRGVADGAELIAGGEGRPAGIERGYFVRPTVFAGVTNDMAIAREEIFGPVLSVIAYDGDDDAVRIANDTTYGLHAYVSGGDAERAAGVASRLVAGRVFVNGLFDEPKAPFGGFKQSGIGRELGVFGLEAYLEPKTTIAA